MGPNVFDVFLKFIVSKFDMGSSLRGAPNKNIVVAPCERVHMEPKVGSNKVADSEEHK